jgi:hypothetical protein
MITAAHPISRLGQPMKLLMPLVTGRWLLH